MIDYLSKQPTNQCASPLLPASLTARPSGSPTVTMAPPGIRTPLWSTPWASLPPYGRRSSLRYTPMRLPPAPSAGGCPPPPPPTGAPHHIITPAHPMARRDPIATTMAQFGFVETRRTKHRHWQHPSGATVSTSATPSDRRALLSIQRDIRRALAAAAA